MLKALFIATAFLASVAGGMIIPWATCFISVQTTEELLRPDYGEMSETFKQFHSGFPFPFLVRSDIGVGGSFIWKFYWMDVAIWTIILFLSLFIGIRFARRRLFKSSFNKAMPQL